MYLSLSLLITHTHTYNYVFEIGTEEHDAQTIRDFVDNLLEEVSGSFLEDTENGSEIWKLYQEALLLVEDGSFANSHDKVNDALVFIHIINKTTNYYTFFCMYVTKNYNYILHYFTQVTVDKKLAERIHGWRQRVNYFDPSKLSPEDFEKWSEAQKAGI